MTRIDSVALPHVAVISSGRPGRVEDMNVHLGPLAALATWYVGEDEEDDYRYAGAGKVVPSGLLAASRNAALEAAFAEKRTCVQISDDLTGIDWTPDRERKYRVGLGRAISAMTTLAQVSGGRKGAHLFGVAATDNLFFLPKDVITRQCFIIGDLMAVLPTPLRFRDDLNLKEDLEFSIQHLKMYGEVARLNSYLPGFQHRTNLGGAVQYRTAAGEQDAIRRIEALHPGAVRENPTRPNEILLVWPPKAEVSPIREATA